jgi:hypothetical protein
MTLGLLDISASRRSAARPPKPQHPVAWETVRVFPDGTKEQLGPRGRRRRGIFIQCVECESEKPEVEFAYLSREGRGWQRGICGSCSISNMRRAAALAKQAERRAITDRYSLVLENAAEYGSAERRIAIFRFASPEWRDRKAISEIYAEARLLSSTTGQPHDVDHYYPLQSPICCGLHIAENLRVVKASVNRSKGNGFPMDQSPCYRGMSDDEFKEMVVVMTRG